MSVTEDITEQKAIEAALQNTYEKLKAIIDSSPLAIISVDMEGRITLWSRAAEKIFGWKEDEMLGNLITTLPDDEYHEFHAMRERAMKGGKATELKITTKAKDGRLIEVRLHPAMLYDQEGRPMGMLSVVEDITEQKKIEHAIQESEEKYRFLAENSRDMIWVIDHATHKYSYISPAVEHIRGYTVEEAMEQHLDEIVTPSSLKTIQKYSNRLVQQVAAGKEVEKSIYEVEYICKDGSTIWVEINTSPILDASGKLVAVHGVSRDISERKSRDVISKLSDDD